MKQIKDISKVTLCSDVKPPVVRQSFVATTAPDIGYFDTVYPALIYRVQNKNRGTRQSNLIPVSAGNDLQMSTMRPNPFSIGIDKRRSKLRGFLQLSSQAV